MGSRFDDLQHFLPPAPRPAADEPDAQIASVAAPPRRARLHRPFPSLRRVVGLVVMFGAVAVLVAGLAVTLRSSSGRAPARSEIAGHGIDVSLGSDASTQEDGQARHLRSHERTPGWRRVREPRRYRHTLVTRDRSSYESRPAGPIVVAPPQAAPPRETQAAESRRKTGAERASLPMPPQTPLFHCVSEPGSEHYVTIDRARAGQLGEPRSGWDCAVVGQVYQDEAPGRSEIELDDGVAYVLTRRARTDPRVEVVPLYRHWAGDDLYYSRSVADGGMVGFVGS